MQEKNARKKPKKVLKRGHNIKQKKEKGTKKVLKKVRLLVPRNPQKYFPQK